MLHELGAALFSLLLATQANAATIDLAPIVESMVRTEAIARKVDADLVVRIVKAESGFDIGAKNPKSSASGLFQFLDGTFKGYCIKTYHLATEMDEKDNALIQTRCAIQMIEDGGLNHWRASRHMWYNK